MIKKNPVKVLDPQVARKIAAGEVIDRPCAIIRELMDNAIDSTADSITVEICGGGIEKIRIVDNGWGMSKEDLQNCARPHATSKILSETDLMNLHTLGFRGEALASIAAVSRLSIISSGWKMSASITQDHILEPVTPVKGTIVQSEGLFENIPARRKFLKRPASEGLMCKNTFIEKALSYPEVAFKFIQDGEIKIDLPSGQTLKDRFISASSIQEDKALFYEVKGESSHKSLNSENEKVPDWEFTVIIGEPAVSRTNKKDILIYANGRRIQEYSLVQAIEYGGQGFFPNGTFPVAAAFIKVNPNLIDFNIHPAKKEARFYDISELHHGLSTSIKQFFQKYTYSNFQENKTADEIRVDSDLFTTMDQLSENAASTENKATSDKAEITETADFQYEKHLSYKRPETGEKSFSDFRSRYLKSSVPSSHAFEENKFNSFKNSELNISSLADQALKVQASQNQNYSIEKTEEVKYIGSCLGTFLLAEKSNCLYIIDQHAVHERIIFDNLMKEQNNSKRQALLIPYKIKTDSKTQDNQLEKLKDSLSKIGFETKKTGNGEWEISTVPERWTLTEYDLRTLIFVKQVEPEEIIRSILAMTACKAAIKDGYVIDSDTAEKLVKQAFLLKDPHCPHGRPVYTVISREKLFELVKRT